MREIKFQCIYRPTKEKFFPHYIDFINTIVVGNFNGVIGNWRHFSSEPSGYGDVWLRQYTGLKDINGREIYKGDVYHQGDPNILYVVEYKGASFVGKQIGSSSYAGLEHWKGRIEVIGEVYRNPDLLEAAE
ncbi:YopX family protein [Bacillus haynesii]|uniref:YopX family protein n=1 Tax=Bacillus haynesii TaxID=1925021 RepID=UPI00227DA6F4|nr:YopX family protein [Bacillus haynesii]MCY8345013.1 YopX family protein [Bacillus haynesii]